MEILKDRPSWFRDCRSLEVFTMFPAGNGGGTIELLYTQVRLIQWPRIRLQYKKTIMSEKNYPYLLSDICPHYTGSCSWFLDSKIHNHLGKRQHRGMHVYIYILLVITRIDLLIRIMSMSFLGVWIHQFVVSFCNINSLFINKGMWEVAFWHWGWPKCSCSFTICERWNVSVWIFNQAVWRWRINYSHCRSP